MQNQLLVIGTVWVAPNSSAAGSRMLQILELFLDRGWKITFACAAQKAENSYPLQSLEIEEVTIKINDASFDTFINNLNPRIVIFDRFLTEEQFGWRVAENSPNTMRILDTEDLHCLRNVRQDCYKKNKEFTFDELKRYDITKREIASILRCDLSLIISTYEMKILKDEFKIDQQLLYYLPFLFSKIDNESKQKWLQFKDREHFIFIGNFYHKPNVDAVLTLKKHIWKTIRTKLPNAELHIYGAYITKQIEQLHNAKEGFLIKGYATNSKRVFSKAKVILAPLNFGAGIKGKLTDAMRFGTPSVTTSIGAEGMYRNQDWSGAVTDNYNTFAEQAIALYTDITYWKTAQENGVNIINEIYDKEKLAPVFYDNLLNILQDLENHRSNNFLGTLLQYQTLQATKYMSKWIEEKNK